MPRPNDSPVRVRRAPRLARCRRINLAIHILWRLRDQVPHSCICRLRVAHRLCLSHRLSGVTLHHRPHIVVVTHHRYPFSGDGAAVALPPNSLSLSAQRSMANAHAFAIHFHLVAIVSRCNLRLSPLSALPSPASHLSDSPHPPLLTTVPSNSHCRLFIQPAHQCGLPVAATPLYSMGLFLSSHLAN